MLEMGEGGGRERRVQRKTKDTRHPPGGGERGARARAWRGRGMRAELHAPEPRFAFDEVGATPGVVKAREDDHAE